MVQHIKTDVYYPESDGQPMGETDRHRQLLTDLVFALTQWFATRDDVYVTGNIFIYYLQGDPNKNVSPDICVVFGSPQRQRDTYQIWRDGPFPQVVIELASTRKRDLGPKRVLYERLGVREYYVFDPHAEGAARVTEPVGDLVYYQRATADEPWGPRRLGRPEAPLHSELLGLALTIRGQELRFLDETTGRLLLTPAEAEAERRQEAAARMVAEGRAEALAEENARLRSLLDQRSET